MREVDEDYLDYIREQPSVVSLRPSDDPHHLESRGSGGSDYTAIPLTRGEHREIHTMPLRDFEEKYGINLWRESHRLLRRYFSDTENPSR